MGTESLQQRLTRWTKVSHFLPITDIWLTSFLQGAGWLDIDLLGQLPVIEEIYKRQQLTPTPVTDAEIIRFNSHIYQNFLWVLAAYEFIRTLDQACDRATGIPLTRKKSIKVLKHKMERIRMPLAKLEPANRYPADFRVALPTWQPGKGVGWFVDQTVLILRVDLSDAMLSTLETA
jgi:hypothetical protein